MKILKTLNITALATLFALSAQAEWVDDDNGDYLTSDYNIDADNSFSEKILVSPYSLDGNGFDITADAGYTAFTTSGWGTNYTISNIGDTSFDYESYIDSQTGAVDFNTDDSTGFNGFVITSPANAIIESNGVGVLLVENTVFSNNSSSSWNSMSLYLKQGNTYVVNDSVFIGNTNTNGTTAISIAKVAKGVSITNTTFVDNVSTNGSGYAGAILYQTSTQNNSAALNINATTDIYNVGNISNNGGFLYISAGQSTTSIYSATVNFNIGTDVEASYYTNTSTDDYVFYTIGNGYEISGKSVDGIHSNIADNVLINKTGDGSLIVNSTMSSYLGALDVQEGKMYLNGQLGSSDITYDESYATSTVEDGVTVVDTLPESSENTTVESVVDESTGITTTTATTIETSVVDDLSTQTTTVAVYSTYEDANTLTSTTTSTFVDSLKDAVTIGTGSMFAVSLTDDTLFTASDSTITINNSGTLIFTAGKEMTSSVATALASSELSITGEGVIKTYGGTLDTTDYTFTKSAITTVSGDTIVSSYSIVSAGDHQVLFSSLSNDITISDVILGSDLSAGIEASIQIQLTDGIVLAETDSAIISFYVGDMAKDISDFNIYVLEDDIWVLQESGSFDYLQYDGDDLIFSVDGTDITATWGYSYGIAVPEPSTYAMTFGAIALGLAMCRRRK